MAENFFMRHYREKNNYTKERVADVLQITEEEYADLESGKAFLKFEMAQQLDAFYKSETSYFYIYGLQNQIVEIQEELIRLHQRHQTGQVLPTTNNKEEEEEDAVKPDKPVEQLLDMVSENPALVISEVFKKRHIDDIRDEIWDWLKSAISNNKSDFEREEARFELMTLYAELLPVLEALHLINEKSKPEDANKQLLSPDSLALQEVLNHPLYLFGEYITHPEKILAPFFEKYSLKHFRLLIKNWLDAGISSEGWYYDKGFERSLLLNLSEHIQCLVEAAYYLNEKEIVHE